MHRLPHSPVDTIPTIIRELDAVLNRRVRSASTNDELMAALRLKHRIKVALAHLPDERLDAAAGAALRWLRQEAADAA